MPEKVTSSVDDAMDLFSKEMHDIKEFVAERVEEGTKPLKEEIERMAEELTKAQNDLRSVNRDKAAKITEGGELRVKEGPLTGYTMNDLAAAESLLTLYAKDEQMPIEDTKLHGVIEEASKGIADSITDDTLEEWVERSVAAMKVTHGTQPSAPAMRKYEDDLRKWQLLLGQARFKAMDSTTAGSGDELVPTFQTAEVWRDVNLATNVLPLFVQTPMPTQPYDIPRDFGDTNWYPIDENIQSLTTDLTTAKDTLSAKGLKTGVPFSDELNEDSIVAFVPELRRTLVRNAAEVIDDVLVNADTTVTNNINADAATISSSDAGKAQWLLGWDGLRHLPLVTNTGQSVARSGAVTANDVYNRALRLLKKYAAAGVRGDVVFISDIQTGIASLALDEVETVDKFGTRATISTGELAGVYGVPLIISEQMLLTASDGLVTDGVAGTVGQLLAVNTTQWRVGFRRGITMEPDREPGKGQTTLYVSMRIAFLPRGDTSSVTHTSHIRDITSVT